MAVRFLLLLLDAAYFDLPDASGELRLRVRRGGFSQDWAVFFCILWAIKLATASYANHLLTRQIPFVCI